MVTLSSDVPKLLNPLSRERKGWPGGHGAAWALAGAQKAVFHQFNSEISMNNLTEHAGRVFFLLSAAVWMGMDPTGVAQTPPAHPHAGTSYYIARQGSDANSGADPRHPWQTIANLNRIGTFGPGDHILFRAGESFAGGLLISLAGTRSSPCWLGSYGSVPPH